MASITVVIPVFNKGTHVDRAINSVLNQTVQDFSLIVVDDNSSDNSRDQIRKFESDNRITVLERDVPGPGGYAARNLGVENSKTNLIAFCDADDEWKPEYLEYILEAFTKFPNAGFVCSGFSIVNGSLVVDRDFDFVLNSCETGIVTSPMQKMAKAGFIHTPCVTVRKQAFEKAGGFPAGKHKRGGDVLLWYEILKTEPIVFVNRRLQNTYIDAENRVTNTDLGARTPVADALERDIKNGRVSHSDGYEWYVRSRLTVIREGILRGSRSPVLLGGLWACRKTSLRRLALIKLAIRYMLPSLLTKMIRRSLAKK